MTFEGVEGSGKSTQIRRLERWLRREGYRPETTSEPDGTALGVAVRRLFEREPRPLAEMFLFMAARHQHVVEKLRPWLRAGRIVLCDRYTDATIAYQGYGAASIRADPRDERTGHRRRAAGSHAPLRPRSDHRVRRNFRPAPRSLRAREARLPSARAARISRDHARRAQARAPPGCLRPARRGRAPGGAIVQEFLA